MNKKLEEVCYNEKKRESKTVEEVGYMLNTVLDEIFPPCESHSQCTKDGYYCRKGGFCPQPVCAYLGCGVGPGFGFGVASEYIPARLFPSYVYLEIVIISFSYSSVSDSFSPQRLNASVCATSNRAVVNVEGTNPARAPLVEHKNSHRL